MKKTNNKGFTLIELLAVIVILGLLMAIAIPSVTRYITQSRKKTLVNSITSFISAATTAVNDQEFGALSSPEKIYYIQVSNIEEESCIALEKGGTNPFGAWKEAYVAVHYNPAEFSYDYYFTYYDDAGYGMLLTKSDDMSTNGTEILNPTTVTADTIFVDEYLGEAIQYQSGSTTDADGNVTPTYADVTNIYVIKKDNGCKAVEVTP